MGKNGVVREPQIHEEVIRKIIDYADSIGFHGCLKGLGGMGRYRDFGKRICHYRLPYSCDGGEYRDGGKLVGEGENHHADDYDSCAAAESAVCVHACSGKASGDSGGILYDFLRRGLYH